jgi:hypothetical protein
LVLFLELTGISASLLRATPLLRRRIALHGSLIILGTRVASCQRSCHLAFGHLAFGHLAFGHLAFGHLVTGIWPSGIRHLEYAISLIEE